MNPAIFTEKFQELVFDVVNKDDNVKFQRVVEYIDENIETIIIDYDVIVLFRDLLLKIKETAPDCKPDCVNRLLENISIAQVNINAECDKIVNYITLINDRYDEHNKELLIQARKVALNLNEILPNVEVIVKFIERTKNLVEVDEMIEHITNIKERIKDIDPKVLVETRRKVLDFNDAVPDIGIVMDFLENTDHLMDENEIVERTIKHFKNIDYMYDLIADRDDLLHEVRHIARNFNNKIPDVEIVLKFLERTKHLDKFDYDSE